MRSLLACLLLFAAHVFNFQDFWNKALNSQMSVLCSVRGCSQVDSEPVPHSKGFTPCDIFPKRIVLYFCVE